MATARERRLRQQAEHLRRTVLAAQEQERRDLADGREHSEEYWALASELLQREVWFEADHEERGARLRRSFDFLFLITGRTEDA